MFIFPTWVNPPGMGNKYLSYPCMPYIAYIGVVLGVNIIIYGSPRLVVSGIFPKGRPSESDAGGFRTYETREWSLPGAGHPSCSDAPGPLEP